MSNTHQNHPIIEREQTYFLDKKHISIHSEDRDLSKWRNSNDFEIYLPENLKNVISLRLSDITLPQSIYNFTNNYQNTKFRIQVISKIVPGSDADLILENNALRSYNNTTEKYNITIDDGYYTSGLLVNEIQNKINNSITKQLIDAGNTLPTGYAYDNFFVKYNSAQHKIEILNNRDEFILHFADEIPYQIDCKYKNVWKDYIKWGFPYFLGFKREQINSFQSNGAYRIDNINYVLEPSNEKTDNIVYYASPKYILNLDTDNVIYMDVDKYNSIDEIEPYSQFTNNEFSNNYAGRTNSAFAKIPIERTTFNKKSFCKLDNLCDISLFKMPITSIRRLKFRLRFHDGRPVDFKNQNFDFTIEACQLIDEQQRFKIINNLYMD